MKTPKDREGQPTLPIGSYHVTRTGEVVVEQALEGHPAYGTVLVIAQAMVIHGEQVSSKGIVCNLHLHVVINTVGEEELL